MKIIIIAIVIALSCNLLLATEVNLNINYNVDGTEFELNKEYTNANGVKYKITRFEYYMHGIELDDQEVGIYVLANGNIRSHNLGDHDLQTVNNLTLSFGVASSDNIGVDPNSFGAFHPLAPKNPSMHWGWNAGYRFWAIEGISDPDGDGQYDKSFQYHILGDESLRTISIPVKTNNSEGVITMMVDFDIQKLLSPVDMTQFGIFHDFYNNSQEVRELVDNITTSKVVSSQVQTSVETIANDLDISPNPVISHLNLNNKYINQDYDIITIEGNRVINGTINSNQISLDNINTGTYFIRIYDENGIINSAKFVKR